MRGGACVLYIARSSGRYAYKILSSFAWLAQLQLTRFTRKLAVFKKSYRQTNIWNDNLNIYVECLFYPQDMCDSEYKHLYLYDNPITHL